jgi:hypothetical protein
VPSWGSTWRYPNWGLYYSISYLGLARASPVAGDTANASRAYQDFLTLWKDARRPCATSLTAAALRKTDYCR